MSPDAPDLITVSALLARVESRIETLATGWWITGEVAEAKVSAANHCYFTLRDEGGQIRCVLFAGVLKSLEAAGDFEIRAGDKLEVAGSLMVYPRSGDLQLRVLRVRRAGMGALYEAFLRLRAKLETEGLFRPERKKPLPALFPRTGDRTCLRCHPRLAKGALLPTFTLLNAEHVGPYCPKGVGVRPGGAIGSLPPAAFAAPAALWRGVRAVTSPALSVFGYWPYYTPQRGKCQTHIAQMSTGWSKYSPGGKCQREKRKGASYHNVLS